MEVYPAPLPTSNGWATMRTVNIAPTLIFEEQAWSAGRQWVAGVDEVGVGPLAGPVAAGAVALRPGQVFPWFKDVRDSKMLKPEQREALAIEIEASVHWAVGWASAEEIDQVGIYQARKLCIMRALGQLRVWPGLVISDALKLPLPGNLALVRADVQCVSVAAASIVAKVARDRLMVEMCEAHHGYAFCKHKGYATPEHKRLLQARGPSPIHRKSWAPVMQAALPW